MIDLSRMILREEEDPNLPFLKRYSAGYKLSASVAVDERMAPVDRSVVEDKLREILWRTVYSDLIIPLCELQRELEILSPAYVPERVHEKMNKVLSLLKRPPTQHEDPRTPTAG